MLLLPLVLSAHAADLDLAFRAPDGSTTAVVLRDVGAGALPGLQMACCEGEAWHARLRLEDGSRLAVDLAEGGNTPPLHLDLALTPGEVASGAFPSAEPGWTLTARLIDLGAPTAAEEEAANGKMAAASAALKAGEISDALGLLREVVAGFPETKAGVAAPRMVNELDLIGRPAPALDVARWLQGAAPPDPAAPLLLVFTEEWCPHCKTSLPSLVSRAKDFRERGMNVVLVTRLTKTSTEAKLLAWLREARAKFPVALDRASVTTDAYRVTGIPAVAIVRGGVVVWRGHPERLEPELLDRVLLGAGARP